MGVTESIRYYEAKMILISGMKYSGLNWCELGDQTDNNYNPEKLVLEAKGVTHTSLDLNGRHGSLPVNLDNPIPDNMRNSFNVVTDYGTLEHVNNQFQAFKNVHDMCKEEGIMIHILPLTGCWPDHGRYYYSLDFFKKLIELSKYQLINVQLLDKFEYSSPRIMVAATFKKNKESKFVTKEEFDNLDLKDSEDLKNTGHYTKNLFN